MEPTINELRKNYERFDDAKLIRLVSEEATRLRPEALELLKQIIRERRLSVDLVKSIDVQFQKIDEKALLGYIELLRKQPCPFCGSMSQWLNATLTTSVISFIVVSYSYKELIIACPNCMDKKNNNAMFKSVLLGWWSIHGAINTVKALILNNKMKKQNHMHEANALFRNFVLQRVGRIEANKNNVDELQNLIRYIR